MTVYHDYTGVIHVHSRYSDGLKNITNIINAANNAGCHFMILSDHDTIEGFSKEGVYKNTILLVGEEVTIGEDEGHYLAFNIDSKINPNRAGQETIDQVRKKGGLGFIAHPYPKSRYDNFKFDAVNWDNWNVSGFNGIEIWNYSHDWVEDFNIFNFLIGLNNPDTFIDGPKVKTIKKWDQLLYSHKVTAIGSVDAHGYFYPYQKMFKMLHTHLLLKNPLGFISATFLRDKALIYKALENGNSYISYDYLANAEGFIYSAINRKKEVIMGDEIELGTGVVLKLFSPKPALLRIIKNGKIIGEKNNKKSLKKRVIEPGAYRAEVYIKRFRRHNIVYRPWIFSNPIFII